MAPKRKQHGLSDKAVAAKWASAEALLTQLSDKAAPMDWSTLSEEANAFAAFWSKTAKHSWPDWLLTKLTTAVTFRLQQDVPCRALLHSAKCDAMHDPSTNDTYQPEGGSCAGSLAQLQTVASLMAVLVDAAEKAREGDTTPSLKLSREQLLDVALKSGMHQACSESARHLHGKQSCQQC